MLTYEYIPHIFTAFAVLIMAIIVIYLIRVSSNRDKQERRFQQQLQFTVNPEKDLNPIQSDFSKKLEILPDLMIKAGVVAPNTSREELQKKINLVMAMVFLFVVILSRNPLVAVFPPLIVYAGLYGFAYFKLSKIKKVMEEQIPSFISTFKANIQANQHPQNAMIRAIDETASPLYDQLAFSKEIMEAGDFRPGIVALRMGTDNETLRHLSTCIELASDSGSNLVEQLDIVEDIIEDKQALERKKNLGINENKPLFIISILVVPVIFLMTYGLNDMYRDFWFKSAISWFILIFIAIGLIIAGFATWKVIEKVDIA